MQYISFEKEERKIISQTAFKEIDHILIPDDRVMMKTRPIMKNLWSSEKCL